MLIRLIVMSALLSAAATPALGQSARPAAPANSNVPRAIYITQMDTEFRQMDADKNGQVTRGEVEGFERSAAVAQARARTEAMFTSLDTDKNGSISPLEFGKLAVGSPAVDGRPLIGKLDTNKDGQISLIEHRGGKLSYFDQIDIDKDGVVTVAEMKTAGVIK